MKFIVNEYGCHIKLDNVNIYLSQQNIYRLIIKLKKCSEWNERLTTIVNAKKETNIGRGNCPFPFDCNNFSECKDVNCKADTLNDGYVYKMS